MRPSFARIKNVLGRHQFTVAIALVIGVGILMTTISMYLYTSSGALQLDLSRPGYESVRDDINKDSKKDFSSFGPIDAGTLEDFQKLYSSQRSQLNSISEFNDDTLSDDTLGVMSTSMQNQ